MWKLYHKLFGWDYIHWHNTVDQGVRRVYKDGLNRVYYVRYFITGVFDIVKDPKDVIWLTCSPDKYFK